MSSESKTHLFGGKFAFATPTSSTFKAVEANGMLCSCSQLMMASFLQLLVIFHLSTVVPFRLTCNKQQTRFRHEATTPSSMHDDKTLTFILTSPLCCVDVSSCQLLPHVPIAEWSKASACPPLDCILSSEIAAPLEANFRTNMVVERLACPLATTDIMECKAKMTAQWLPRLRINMAAYWLPIRWNPICLLHKWNVRAGSWGSKMAAADGLLVSHQGEPGPIPSRVNPGFSQVGVVPDDAASPRVFSGISSFLRSCIPALVRALLHSLLISPSSALKTSQLCAKNEAYSLRTLFIASICHSHVEHNGVERFRANEGVVRRVLSRAGMQGMAETGYLRENPPTSSIFQNDSQVTKFLERHHQDTSRFALLGGELSSNCTNRGLRCRKLSIPSATVHPLTPLFELASPPPSNKLGFQETGHPWMLRPGDVLLASVGVSLSLDLLPRPLHPTDKPFSREIRVCAQRTQRWGMEVLEALPVPAREDLLKGARGGDISALRAVRCSLAKRSATKCCRQEPTECKWNARTREAGEPLENPPASSNFRYVSHARNTGVTSLESEAWCSHYTTMDSIILRREELREVWWIVTTKVLRANECEIWQIWSSTKMQGWGRIGKPRENVPASSINHHNYYMLSLEMKVVHWSLVYSCANQRSWPRRQQTVYLPAEDERERERAVKVHVCLPQASASQRAFWLGGLPATSYHFPPLAKVLPRAACNCQFFDTKASPSTYTSHNRSESRMPATPYNLFTASRVCEVLGVKNH
ncbi:hypothetical protein PR048_019706 [Dryococelus australis]|uniref:Uncharacterized protein n=1 Tax=Dryococelus australis TaxID=614101 RepID=A0ABQ9H4C3_9NEOP|nr:hypothetical protein PR048_019706 [Dryococelus australis]